MKNRKHISCYKFNGYTLYPNEFLKKNGKVVSLPPKELKVLSCLVELAGKVVSKDALLQYAWGDASVSDESLTRCIYALRRQLGDKAERKCICTIYAQGYYFNVPVERCAPEISKAADLNVNSNHNHAIIQYNNNDHAIEKTYEIIDFLSNKLLRKSSDIEDMKHLADSYLSIYIMGNSSLDTKMIKRIRYLANNILTLDPFDVDALAILGVSCCLCTVNECGSLYFLQAKILSPNNTNIDYYRACQHYLKKEYIASYNILKNTPTSKKNHRKLNFLMNLVQGKIKEKSQVEEKL